MVFDEDSAITACTRCRTVWDQGHEIKAALVEFRGRWYIGYSKPLPII